MKRIISLFSVVIMLFACLSFTASAEDAAKTEVSVKKGDEVVYTLYLYDVPEKVVGCDFSMYYDSDLFKVKSVADFTGKTSKDDYQAVVNPDLPGEIRSNFSILSGINFSSKMALLTVTLTAKTDGDGSLSYYMRYLYPESLEQFTKYTFTCDVTVNGSAVIKDEAPELNVDSEQTSGEFVNSVTGKSDDANVNTYANAPSGKVSSNAEVNENSVTTSSGASSSSSDLSQSQGSTPTLIEASPNQSTGSQTSPKGLSPAMWIIIGIIVVGAAAAIIYAVKKKKATPEQK